jgi:hypothetical protein
MRMSDTATGAGAAGDDRTGWLGHAAAPIFLVMACVSATGAQDMAICTSTASWLPVGDMTLMYALMGIFHLPPWIRHQSARSRHPLPENPKETEHATCRCFTR